MMRGLPFWLSMLILVVLWLVFSVAIARFAPSLRPRAARRGLYAFVCAVLSLAIILALMKFIVVFFN